MAGTKSAPLRVLPFFPAYLAGMNLVVLADDAFSFLIAWEFMSLSSWALVMANHRAPENARAGYIYLVMASFGTLALLLAFGLLAGAGGDYAFAAMRANHPAETTGLIVLLLALLGAGSKAGLVPLHVWLPLAHPAAPSHVSALMSGVMTKIAVYGFIRIVFDLVGEPVWWSSMIVLALAGITTVLGVLYALMQHDLKRLLAYHTVENIGIIFIGIGLAMAFRASNMSWAAALALTAALFHVLNHSIFKSLLFFGAGAVSSATGERNMEHLGGLIHRMPKTAVAFLIGCVAISALPPLNGFVSEWLTFQAILVSPQISQWGPRFLIPAVGALLALSAALAAACFVKAYGVTFLGRPRTSAAETASETDGFSLAAMFALAALCVILGVVPGAVVELISPVVQRLGRRAHAGAVLFALVVAHSDRREPQLLQRPHYPVVSLRHPASPPPCSSIASRRRRRGAARSGTVAIPMRHPPRNTPVQASRCRSAGCSARRCSTFARWSICRAPATRARRAITSRCSIRPGAMLTGRWRAGCCALRRSSTASNFCRSAAISRWSSSR